LHVGEYADPDRASSGQANQRASRRRKPNNRWGASSTNHGRRRARHDDWRAAAN
jgi:hypothetical protein